MQFTAYIEILIITIMPTTFLHVLSVTSCCVTNQHKTWWLKATTKYFNESKQTLQGQLVSPINLSPAQLISAGFIHTSGERTRDWLVYEQALLHGVSHFPPGQLYAYSVGGKKKFKRENIPCQAFRDFGQKWDPSEQHSMKQNKSQGVRNRFHLLMRRTKVTMKNEKLGQFLHSVYHICLLYARHC